MCTAPKRLNWWNWFYCPREGCEVLRSSCLHVCLSACITVVLKHVLMLRNFLYMLHTTVASLSSDDNAIRYVFLVLLMTSFLWCLCGVRWCLRPRDVSQREATQRGAELKRFSSVPLSFASRWLTSLGFKSRRGRSLLHSIALLLWPLPQLEDGYFILNGVRPQRRRHLRQLCVGLYKFSRSPPTISVEDSRCKDSWVNCESKYRFEYVLRESQGTLC